MNTEIIHEACEQSVTNNLPFPEVVKRLTQAEVETYYADLGQLQKTYYGSEGEFCVSRMVMEPLGPIGDPFDAKLIQEAIQAIMQRKITYVEFLRRIVGACISPTRCISGVGEQFTLVAPATFTLNTFRRENNHKCAGLVRSSDHPTTAEHFAARRRQEHARRARSPKVRAVIGNLF